MDSAARRNEPSVSASLAVDAPASSSQPDLPAVATSVTLADVYAAHHEFVWRSLARLGVDDDRLADAAHDVFMVVARRLPEFEGRASLKTWLFAIALRVARGHRRDDARERKRRARVGHHEEPMVAPHARADAARELRDMLLRLPEDKRAVFIMAELEGMSAPEISVVLEINPNTVYSRLRLAREQLQRMVARIQARAEGEARVREGGMR
jgi:RNA polymerase sigma-70 factor (ECF subfamily)